jgi:hypothetical protein
MGDLQEFERFEPRAWQDRVFVKPLLPEKPMRPENRRWVNHPQLAAATVVVSMLAVGGLTETQSFTIGSDRGQFVSAPHATGSREIRRAGPDLDKRIHDLAALQEGWFDGEGVVFDGASLSTLRALLDKIPEGIPWPYLYPAPNGEISAEWRFGDWEVELTFDPAVTRSEALAINTRTREKEAMEVPLSRENAPARLGRFVEKFSRIQSSTC